VVTNYRDDPKSLDRLARWWALRDTPVDLDALAVERDDIETSRARLREMYAAGDFADDPAQYRKLFDRYNQRYEQITAELDKFEALPPPKLVMKGGFFDTLDFATKRELIAELLHIECIQAERPGIRFDPAKRLKLKFRTGTKLIELEIL
jgi:hypothetical protein